MMAREPLKTYRGILLYIRESIQYIKTAALGFDSEHSNYMVALCGTFMDTPSSYVSREQLTKSRKCEELDEIRYGIINFLEVMNC